MIYRYKVNSLKPVNPPADEAGLWRYLLFRLKAYHIITWGIAPSSMTSSKPQAVGLKQSILIIKAAKHSYLSLNIGVLK
jgi:hypothetical protein